MLRCVATTLPSATGIPPKIPISKFEATCHSHVRFQRQFPPPHLMFCHKWRSDVIFPSSAAAPRSWNQSCPTEFVSFVDSLCSSSLMMNQSPSERNIPLHKHALLCISVPLTYMYLVIAATWASSNILYL